MLRYVIVTFLVTLFLILFFTSARANVDITKKPHISNVYFKDRNPFGVFNIRRYESFSEKNKHFTSPSNLKDSNKVEKLMKSAYKAIFKYMKHSDYDEYDDYYHKLKASNQDNNIDGELLYLDASASLLSHAFRNLTNHKFDLMLLTSEEDHSAFSGFELGFMPLPHIGFKVSVDDIKDENTLGMELTLRPNKYSALKFKVDTNDNESRTGFQMHLKF